MCTGEGGKQDKGGEKMEDTEEACESERRILGGRERESLGPSGVRGRGLGVFLTMEEVVSAGSVMVGSQGDVCMVDFPRLDAISKPVP